MCDAYAKDKNLFLLQIGIYLIVNLPVSLIRPQQMKWGMTTKNRNQSKLKNHEKKGSVTQLGAVPEMI